MNQKVSRRELARTIVEQLLAEPSRQKHWIKVLAAYLVEWQRLDELDLLMNDIAHELYVQAGTLTTEVVSARQLSESVRKHLVQYLQKETDAKQVVLHETVDKEVVGGLIARTADHALDTTVQKRLRELAAVA